MKKYTVQPRVKKRLFRKDQIVYDIYKRVSDDVYRFGQMEEKSKIVKFHTCLARTDAITLANYWNDLEK